MKSTGQAFRPRSVRPPAFAAVAAWLPAILAAFALLAIASTTANAQYQRQVDVVPSAEDIGDEYVTPLVQRPLPRADWWNAVDVAALVVGLALSSWLVLKKRSRAGSLLLTIACLLYFGFYRQGCVCPIGAIQNVAVSLTDSSYTIPVVVTVFFFLPLLTAFFFGRAFCGGVCPLGAIQELVLIRDVQVPRKLDKWLGLLKYVYLVVAVILAIRPAADREFIICRFDPFVGFFRMTGSGWVLMFGGALLIIGTVVGRPYCRYLCPYGGLLAPAARFSWRGVSITPSQELDCGLCVEACPYGAIEKLRAVKSSCLYCARCYAACPNEPVNHPAPTTTDTETPPETSTQP